MLSAAMGFVFITIMIVIGASIVATTATSLSGLSNQTSCSGIPLNNPDDHIVDLAGVLSSSERTNLAKFIGDTYSSKCIDIGVIIANDTNGTDLLDYTTNAFDKAGLGGKNDSGLLMAISVSDKQYFVETGYGLESCMPDGKIGTTARAKMFYPILQDYSGGRTGGGGQGGAMKASGYGQPIVETLGTLVEGCEGTASTSEVSSTVATLANIVPLIMITVIGAMAILVLLSALGSAGDY